MYPPGAFYRRHLDRFASDDRRALSCVLYLNEAWRAEDGGALRLYLPGRHRDVLPRAGTLVAFLSERFEHEVLPAQRERLSLTRLVQAAGVIPGRREKTLQSGPRADPCPGPAFFTVRREQQTWPSTRST